MSHNGLFLKEAQTGNFDWFQVHLQRQRAQVSILFYNWDWWNVTGSMSSRWLTAYAFQQGCLVLLSVQCADQKNEIKKFLLCFAFV